MPGRVGSWIALRATGLPARGGADFVRDGRQAGMDKIGGTAVRDAAWPGMVRWEG
ncbi:hypothetical protein GLI01_20340 [Gluconacetobacter liquefaciens]|uniref:Uncharacterized protein n=1 Tax=Gluconacetobacter liquefaciens TaxID=89584 RepID=A0A370G8G7_GLULI|nr:hypothetical protein C7453_10216 [Gluconacetobacter liquefaciens]GEB37999.1 hypothetical protein GLI01_20340 [Gluconacetobacter liquefaciens]